MSKKHKKVCRTLNCFERFLVFISPISGCVSIFAFASMIDIPVGITGSAVESKIYAIKAGIKKYKSIIKKKEKKL